MAERGDHRKTVHWPSELSRNGMWLLTTSLQTTPRLSIVLGKSRGPKPEMWSNPMRKLIDAFFAIGITAVMIAPFGTANANPALWLERKQLRIPFGSCVGAAFDAVKKAGLPGANKDTEGAGGTTASARGTIRCVRLPHAGPCNTDGATAVFIAASDKSLDDAKDIVQRMSKALGDPVLIDCN
jgi:hypothetical protein